MYRLVLHQQVVGGPGVLSLKANDWNSVFQKRENLNFNINFLKWDWSIAEVQTC